MQSKKTSRTHFETYCVYSAMTNHCLRSLIMCCHLSTYYLTLWNIWFWLVNDSILHSNIFAKLYNDHSRQPIFNIAVLVSGLSYDPTVSPLTLNSNLYQYLIPCIYSTALHRNPNHLFLHLFCDNDRLSVHYPICVFEEAR